MRFQLVVLIIVSILVNAQAEDRPNVLFIVIDDLNAQVGFLGDSSAKTPNMDGLAGEATVFTRAYCQEPICNPSRTSFLTGRYPHSTGIYGLSPYFWEVPELENVKSLPQYFRENGYFSVGVGKIFHGPVHEESFDRYDGWFDGYGPQPDNPIHLDPDLPVHPFYDWGAFLELGETTDFRIAEAACQTIRERVGGEKPFFLSVGIIRPHAPLYAPQEFFDQHPLGEISSVENQSQDVEDISPYALKLVNYSKRQLYSDWLREKGYTDDFLQAYEASVSLADHCVGMVLKTLEESGFADNTIVIITGDHGIQNGAKNIWYKRTLWEKSIRVPLLIKIPGKRMQIVDTPVGLIDIYPTLCDLADLEPQEDLEGVSLEDILNHKALNRPPVLSVHGPGNYSLRHEHWHYIRYADGSEELYDLRSDPEEHDNLAFRDITKSNLQVIEKLRSSLPAKSAPFVPGTSGFWSDAFPDM